MPIAQNLSLRVNGVVYERVGLQHALENQVPTGAQQVVIKDAAIGEPFTLTDDCKIELRDGDEPWRVVTLAYLTTILQTFKE